MGSDLEKESPGEVMHRLLYLLNVIISIPLPEKLGIILNDLIKHIPYFENTVICLGKTGYADPDGSVICVTCKNFLVNKGEHFPCPLVGGESWFTYQLSTSRHFFGYVHSRLPEENKPELDAILANFTNIVAVILENIQIKEELQNTIIAFEEAQHISRIGHCIHDPSFNRSICSPQIENIYGPEPNTFRPIIERILGVIHPLDREVFLRKYNSSVTEQKPFQMIHRIVDLDGKIKFIDGRFSHQIGSHGGILQSMWTSMDITDRTASELYRARNESRLRLLLELNRRAMEMDVESILQEGVDIAVHVTDSACGYLYMIADDQNTITLSTWDVSTLSECQSKQNIDSPLDNKDIRAKALRLREPVIQNDLQPHADGNGLPESETFIFRQVAVPVMDGPFVRIILGVGNKETPYDSSDIEQIQLVGNEILKFTIRRQMEEQLNKSNRELQSQVNSELEKIRKQEQMLIQQSRMASTGEMIGIIAHQWRQPLNALSILIQDIEEAFKSGELTDSYLNSAIDKSMGQILFMAQTIDDFKNFFKPSKEKSSFDVSEAILNISRLFAIHMSQHSIRLDINPAVPVALIAQGYPNEFKQVIMIILNNARDAIENRKVMEPTFAEGSIKIQTTMEKDRITVSIADNGGGIPDAIMANLFEPYITTKGAKGTGVGLYMSRTIIVENMGGRMRAENGDDGAIFTIELPREGVTLTPDS